MPPKENYISEEIIETISPSDLLRKHNIDSIDILAIDTEGFDFEVIKMFDIPTTKPRLIIYENLHLKKEDKTEAINHLRKNNYTTKNIGKDTISILSNDNEIDILMEDR